MTLGRGISPAALWVSYLNGGKRPYATKDEAIAYAHKLMMRQFSVRATRVVETDDPINYAYVDGRMGVIG